MKNRKQTKRKRRLLCRREREREYLSRQKILIVDDSTMIRERVAMILEPENYEVIKAEDGYVASKELARGKIELVIADIFMPIIDGVELIKIMKSTSLYKDIPIIVLTTEKDQETQKKILEIDPDVSFLIKPFTSEILIQEVEKVLIGRGKVAKQKKKPPFAEKKEIPNRVVEEKIRAYEELFQEIWDKLVPFIEIRVIVMILNKVSLQVAQKYPILQYLEIYTGGMEKKTFDKMALHTRLPSESALDLTRGFKMSELISLGKLKRHITPKEIPMLHEAIKEFLTSFISVIAKFGAGAVLPKDISDKIADL